MPDEKKKIFPRIPERNWWILRNKFKQSIPNTVDSEFLSTVLKMNKASARTNIMPSLKMVKIIDEDGKTLERAKRWRDDIDYPKVCEEIKNEIYPQALLDTVPDPIADRDTAKRWFANRTGAGKVSVRKMTSFYTLICEADPLKKKEIVSKTPPKKKKEEPEKVKKKEEFDEEAKLDEDKKVENKYPSVHVNIQIHITPEVSPEQIDQIFSSMAKHFYKIR